MKSIGRLVALIALFGAKQISAAPALAVGDNAELFLTATGSLVVDDNIYLRKTNRTDDLVYTFTPGLDLVFGRNAVTSGNLFYKQDIVRYQDTKRQNTSLANFGLNTVYSNGKTKFDFGAGYAETAQNEPGIAGFIIEREYTRARAIAEFGVSEKTTVGAGVRYDDYDYKQAGFGDTRSWTAPLDVYFEISPKLQMSVGYQYRSTDVANNVDSKDHFFNVGARGEFTPKLSGQVRVGYTSRNYSGTRGSDSSIGLDSSLAYALTQKTSLQVAFRNEFGTSALGTSTKNFSADAGITSNIDDQWNWSVNGTYRTTDYFTRSDDLLQVSVGTGYRYNEYLSFTGSYTYRTNSSSVSSFDFKNNLFSVAANIRY